MLYKTLIASGGSTKILMKFSLRLLPCLKVIHQSWKLERRQLVQRCQKFTQRPKSWCQKRFHSNFRSPANYCVMKLQPRTKYLGVISGVSIFHFKSRVPLNAFGISNIAVLVLIQSVRPYFSQFKITSFPSANVSFSFER